MVIGNIKNKISNFQNLFNIPTKANADISEEELCKLLNTNLDALKAFEEGYEHYSESQGLSDNLFRINSRQVAEIKEGMLTDVPAELQDVVEKIVSDLVSQTIMYSYDGKRSIVLIIVVIFHKVEELPPKKSRHYRKTCSRILPVA